MGVSVGQGVVGSAITAFLTTLVVGAILVAVVSEYTERTMDSVLEDPVWTFVYGLLSLVVIFLLAFVLVITVIGILVAIPLLLLAYVAWAIGSAIAFIAIGDRLVGHDDGWAAPLVIGAAINGALVVTGIGGLLSFVIGAAGFGAVLSGWLG